MLLFRSCTPGQDALIIQRGTAGGAEKVLSCGKPSNAEAVQQVGNNEGVGFNPSGIIRALTLRVDKGIPIAIPALTEDQRKQVFGKIDKGNKDLLSEAEKIEVKNSVEPRGVVEYTSDQEIAMGFGGTVIRVEIDDQYLIKGSGIEKGWIAYNCAPVKSISKIPRT